MNTQSTTRIVIHNLTTNEITIVGDRTILGNFFGLSKDTVKHWFVEDKKPVKIVKKQFNGQTYMIYKADNYIPSISRNPTGKH